LATCGSCGGASPDGFRFCGSCGARLIERAADGPGETRRTVTVLFADVTGSTELGERLDPETMRRLLGRTFAAARELIESHGGTVEKFIGDAVMAVFGVPIIHEDDALRAARAASDLGQALGRLSAETLRDHGVRLELRTGINTGEVVAGDPAAGSSFVTGDAVNVAARLEQAAGPGEILLGEATYRLVRDAVDVEGPIGLDMKGKAASVPAYRLRRVDPGAPARLRRLDTPLVGRVRELRLLGHAFERVVSDRACQLFTVLGTAGVGKSRLVAAFLEQAGGGATVLSGRCLPYGQNITFWPIAEIVRSAAAVASDDTPEGARAKVRGLLDGEPDADMVAERIGQAVALDETHAPLEETFWAIRRLLEALARERPLVVVIDDLQWAAPTMLELVEHAVDWTRDSRILVLAMGRPELLDARPGWGGGKLNATTILLEPLSDVECGELVDQILGHAPADPRIRRRVADASEGNPLFVEELVAMLVEDGLLRRAGGTWVPAGDLSHIAVPPTIAALIAARLDRLAAGDRAILERASVVGRVFDRAALWELMDGAAGTLDGTGPPATGASLAARLDDLVHRELIRPDRTASPGGSAYRFRHQLVRDAAYDGLSKDRRAELHLRFGSWLERTLGDRLLEIEEIVGFHLEQAHRYRHDIGPVDDTYRDAAVRGGTHLGAAGRRALARGDLPAAVGLLDRASALLPDASPGRAGILAALGSALTEQGEFVRAAAVFAGATEAAAAAGDSEQASHTSLTRLHLFFFTDPNGVAEATQREVERLIPLFTARGDELGLAKARRRLAMVYRTRRDIRGMEAELERAIAHARAAGDGREEARSLGLMATAAFLGPTPAAEGIERCSRIRDEAGGNSIVERAVLVAQGGLEAMDGGFDEARAHLDEHARLCGELGIRLDAAEGRIQRGFVELLAGDAGAAAAALATAVADLQAMGERTNLAMAAALLGGAQGRLGHTDEALAATRLAEATAAPDDLGAQVSWRVARADVELAAGTIDESRRLAEEAVRLAGQTDSYELRGQAQRTLADVEERRSDPAAARAAREQALRSFGRKGDVVSAARIRAQLGEQDAAATPDLPAEPASVMTEAQP
jgi:class 3 adenylate cyclase/tetratricopeptide (TPR) repeat protein